MSDTVHCFDDNLKREVVVKSLKPGIALHRLQDELSALSAIRSRYVVQILDVIKDTSGNIVGFVEEFLAGDALKFCATPLSKDEALRALYPVAAGIAEVHDHGRVHRDIKPDNMRFDENGQLKIFDFGLAKLQSSTGTTSFYFSAGYTAPEAFPKSASGLHTFTTAVDVFAFGCVGVWLLNNGNLPPELISIPPTLPIPGFSFSSLAPVLPPSVSALLDGCVDPNPAVRPSMDVIRRALEDEILRDRHKMLLTHNGNLYVVDKAHPTNQLTWQTSKITISYDGVAFRVSHVEGTVMINNSPAIVGQRLHGSYVIVLGVDEPSGLRRASVTADVSHPEVML